MTDLAHDDRAVSAIKRVKQLLLRTFPERCDSGVIWLGNGRCDLARLAPDTLIHVMGCVFFSFFFLLFILFLCLVVLLALLALAYRSTEVCAFSSVYTCGPIFGSLGFEFMNLFILLLI